MKYIALILLSSLSLLSFASNDSLDVLGVWETQHKGTYVLITPDALNNPVSGEVTFSDKENVLIGKQVLSNFEKDEDGWSVTLYSIERDKNFEGRIHREGDTLVIDVSVLFFSKTIEWTKKTDADVAKARAKMTKSPKQ